MALLPSPFAHSLARRERDALCDLALTLGATAPTLCEGWTVKDLVLHLLVRERWPWLALGDVVPPLSAKARQTRDELASRDIASLVTQLRSVPLPLALIDPALNTVELFVHHEDLRRGSDRWEPRDLAPADEAQLWRSLALLGRLLVRRAGVPVVVTSGDRRAVLRGGADPVVLSGPVSELLLFLFGRTEVRDLSFDGPAERVVQLKTTQLSV